MTSALGVENYKQIATFVQGARKSILLLGSTLILGTGAVYCIAPKMLAWLQGHLSQKLAFFAVAEPFVALVQLSFFVSLFFFMPWAVYAIGRALAKPLGLSSGSVFWFVAFACLLFYAGAGFCYFVTLPYGIQFLLGFQSEQLKPVISVGKFVSFVTIFLFGFGIIFELPLCMAFAVKARLCSVDLFYRYRRHAILMICIVAAILTPTPDVVNMMLMAIPLYLLYETGIIAIRVLRF